MKTNEIQTVKPRIVSPAEWQKERLELLAREKELTHARDALAAARRRLPWVKVGTRYVFDGPDGQETLADLFDGRQQLIIYHFMFGPEWLEGCPSCSFAADHFGGMLAHLAQRDVSFAAVSRATLAQIEEFKRRMGWSFRWVSSNRNTFNRDFHVSFTKAELASGDMTYNYARQTFPADEAPGLSVFYRDAGGDVFHTYSAYARGAEAVLGTYQLLDLVPKGRDEDGLAFPMAWVRHHDRYGDGAAPRGTGAPGPEAR